MCPDCQAKAHMVPQFMEKDEHRAVLESGDPWVDLTAEEVSVGIALNIFSDMIPVQDQPVPATLDTPNLEHLWLAFFNAKWTGCECYRVSHQPESDLNGTPEEDVNQTLFTPVHE